MVCDDGVNQKGKGKGSNRGKINAKGKGNCAVCGSSTHLRSSRRDCPFHKGHAKKEAHSDSPVEELISDSESGEDMADGDSSDSEEIPVRVELKGRPTREAVP